MHEENVCNIYVFFFCSRLHILLYTLCTNMYCLPCSGAYSGEHIEEEFLLTECLTSQTLMDHIIIIIIITLYRIIYIYILWPLLLPLLLILPLMLIYFSICLICNKMKSAAASSNLVTYTHMIYLGFV